jgi:hypothetical protein
MRYFDWPITRKKLKLWRLTKIQVSLGDGTHLPWLTYIGEKGENFGLTYRINVLCHWEFLGNTLGTLCEHIGNRKKIKYSLSPTSPPNN